MKMDVANKRLKTTIKDIIEDVINDGQLSLNAKYSLYVKKSGTKDSIIFRDIEFNDFFVWNDDGELIIGNECITSIHTERSTNNQNIDINIGKIEQISFENCTFSYLPNINNRGLWKIEFNDCTFLEGGSDWIPNILAPLRENKRVYIKDCSIESFQLGDMRDIRYSRGKKLCYFELTGGSINDLTIQNVEIASKFYINKQYRGNSKETEIKNLKIDSAIFLENFKLHRCKVNNAIIEDTDFEKHADFYHSTFNSGLNNDDSDPSIYFKALNFRGLTLFGDCTFIEKLNFKYVTFEKFSHFRRAKFMNGLDLDYSNIQKEMNFFGIEGLDTEQSIKNTSQETYRIIKYNFDKIGNTIEGNKFFSLEMKRYKDNLFSSNWKKNIQKKFVFLLNEKISNYGQSYIKSIAWIIILAIFYKYIVDGTVNSLLDTYVPSINNTVNKIGNYLNSYVKDIKVLKKILTENYESISLLFNIILSILVWQTIVAVKRDTKR